MLDGWQGSKGLPPSMQCEHSCKTTQQLKSRTRQANGGQTGRISQRTDTYTLCCAQGCEECVGDVHGVHIDEDSKDMAMR